MSSRRVFLGCNPCDHPQPATTSPYQLIRYGRHRCQGHCALDGFSHFTYLVIRKKILLPEAETIYIFNNNYSFACVAYTTWYGPHHPPPTRQSSLLPPHTCRYRDELCLTSLLTHYTLVCANAAWTSFLALVKQNIQKLQSCVSH